MNSNVAVKMLRVFLLLVVCPVAARLQAQSAAAPSPATPSDRTQTEVIPVPQVAEQADETIRLLRDIRRRLPPPEVGARVEKEAAALDEELGEKLREMSELATGTPALLRLRELERYWRGKKNFIAPKKREVDDRLSSLSRDISLLDAQQARWQATLKQIQDTAGLPALSDRIRTVLSDIHTARSQVQQNLNRFASLQIRISRQDLAVSDAL